MQEQNKVTVIADPERLAEASSTPSPVPFGLFAPDLLPRSQPMPPFTGDPATYVSPAHIWAIGQMLGGCEHDPDTDPKIVEALRYFRDHPREVSPEELAKLSLRAIPLKRRYMETQIDPLRAQAEAEGRTDVLPKIEELELTLSYHRGHMEQPIIKGKMAAIRSMLKRDFIEKKMKSLSDSIRNQRIAVERLRSAMSSAMTRAERAAKISDVSKRVTPHMPKDAIGPADLPLPGNAAKMAKEAANHARDTADLTDRHEWILTRLIAEAQSVPMGPLDKLVAEALGIELQDLDLSRRACGMFEGTKILLFNGTSINLVDDNIKLDQTTPKDPLEPRAPRSGSGGRGTLL
jgi:hypothetical protein